MKLPRKLAGFLMTSVFVMIAGVIVKPGNAGAVCLALTGLYATFVTGHTLSDPACNKTTVKVEEKEESA